MRDVETKASSVVEITGMADYRARPQVTAGGWLQAVWASHSGRQGVAPAPALQGIPQLPEHIYIYHAYKYPVQRDESAEQRCRGSLPILSSVSQSLQQQLLIETITGDVKTHSPL